MVDTNKVPLDWTSHLKDCVKSFFLVQMYDIFLLGGRDGPSYISIVLSLQNVIKLYLCFEVYAKID